MLEEIRTEGGTLTGRCISIAAHIVLLALMIGGARHAWQVRPVVGRGGEQSSILYWDDSVGSGSARTHARETPKPAKAHRAALAKPQQDEPALEEQQPAESEASSTAGSSTSQSQNGGIGNGNENATPAFPVYSPSPHIDRALLPRTDENVVVDVNVSAMGEVLDEKLIHGLGNSVDQTILDTVKGWKFHPATVDGNAVASMAELVFPLGQKWRG
ncbi:MAG TPA: energy transducer TonB [Silvibacterium sp.]|nr:energy transducer TonB [Silvibacterium sp.]